MLPAEQWPASQLQQQQQCVCVCVGGWVRGGGSQHVFEAAIMQKKIHLCKAKKIASVQPLEADEKDFLGTKNSIPLCKALTDEADVSTQVFLGQTAVRNE